MFKTVIMNKNIFRIVLFTCLAVLFVTSSSQAQEDKFKKFKIALHASPALSWMKPADNRIEKGKSTLNFGFGIDVDVMFTENYALGTGFSVFKNGGTLSYMNEIQEDTLSYIVNTNDRKYELQYVEVPITLKLRTNEIGYMTYWGQFGVGLGVNIGAHADQSIAYSFQRKVDTTDDWEDLQENSREDVMENEDIKDEIQVFRTSLLMGAGFEYNISGSTSIVVGVVFNNGFSNVLSLKSKALEQNADGTPEVNSDNSLNTFKMKAVSNQISLKVGIMF